VCASHSDPQPPLDLVGDGPDADAEAVARKILLRRLSDRPRTRAELATALTRKGVPDGIATNLLDRFEEVGLVDDQEFARSWVKSRLSGRGLARRSLGAELRRKGVDAETVRTVLDEVDPDEEEAAARQLVRRKSRSMEGLDATVRMRRLTSMLARKGYPPGMAFRVAREEVSRNDRGIDGLGGDESAFGCDCPAL
jgi:regulatory protein